MAHGLVSREALDSLRASLPPEASFEDELVRRGLVEEEALERLLSLAQTPPPEEGTVTTGTPTDHTATVWELEAPDLEALESQSLEEDEVSMDAPTGRFDGARPLVGKTTKWDKKIDDSQLKGRTTRWEVPVPLPEDNPTGQWSTVSRPDAPRRLQPDLESTLIDDEGDPEDFDPGTGFETLVEDCDPDLA